MEKATNCRGHDPELSEKLDALARAVGHLLPSRKFENVAIGDALGIDKSRVTEMRQGRIPFRPHHMARLVAHYGLEGKLDPSDFVLSATEFAQRLRDARIGVYNGGRGRAAKQALFDLTDPTRPTGARCSIEVDVLRHSRRAGGLGLPADERDGPLQLREGDRVRLRVEYPGPGHLIVLDEQVGVETTCLMPSMFAPRTEVRGKSVHLPTEDLDALTASFHVARPEGHHRLFAVWMASAPAPSWLADNHQDTTPTTVEDAELADFVAGLQSAIEKAAGSVAVAIADYRVI